MRKLFTYSYLVGLYVLALAAPMHSRAAFAIGISKSGPADADHVVYRLAANPVIGVAPNAGGSSYAIVNEQGKVVYSGKINASGTFRIPTSRLGNGYFACYINNLLVQHFVVR